MSQHVSWDQSVRVFLQQAGSAEPTPGGGSVAALIAALAAAMTSMVGNLSQGEKFAHIQPQIAEAIGQMNSLTVVCEELLHADIASFNVYMAALKLPKGAEDERLIRKKALQEAVIRAIEVPLRLIEVCKDGIESTFSIAESSNKHVISDLGIGAVLFEAAAQSAMLTVEINLASMTDAGLKRGYADKLDALMEQIESYKRQTLVIARNRMR